MRNRKFAIDVLMTMEVLPSNRIYDALVRQLVRSSTSVGANYRAACRAKSTKDFVNKLKIVEEEADESSYFLDLLQELDKGKSKEKLGILLIESNQIGINLCCIVEDNATKAEIGKNKKSYFVNHKW